ncbi:IS3 family transposase [Kitasatospora sp. NPDC094016]|uniref:IS3 family transposase n=1 Tax=Kitasatospora sp. NPDC094016 TaxID=3154986 RepID=UPI00331D6B70
MRQAAVAVAPPPPAPRDALAESFFTTLKRELLGDRPWPSRAVARTSIFEWIEAWYKIRGLYSSLGCRGPAEYETVLAGLAELAPPSDGQSAAD